MFPHVLGVLRAVITFYQLPEFLSGTTNPLSSSILLFVLFCFDFMVSHKFLECMSLGFGSFKFLPEF